MTFGTDRARAGMLALLVMLGVGCATAGVGVGARVDSAVADASDPANETRDAAVMAVLDRYMDSLNRLDLEGHVATYHFPHYRHASGKIVVWQNAREANPILDVPEAERRTALRRVLEPEWDRSEWTRREIVQGDARKVHVVTRFDRLRADGSVIKSFDSLYVLTLEGGEWGIRGRSSFAP